MFLINPYRFAAPAPTSSTFNSADKNAVIVLSGGDLTAATSSGTLGGVRSTTSKSAGLHHVEATVAVVGTSTNAAFGFANSSYDLTGASGDTNVCGANGTQIFTSAGAVDVINGGTLTAGTIVAYEIDAPAGQWYVQRQGQARQGPYALPGSAPWFYFAAEQLNWSHTVNPGSSAFAITPTSGYSAWG